MTGNSASPFRLREIWSGLYDVVDRGELYQDGDSLVECALGGVVAFPFLEVAPELRLNPRTRRSIADLKQGWPSRGS